MHTPTRRRVLTLTASGVAAGLAGCAGGSDTPSPYDGWLDGANNFAAVVDRTGTATTTIEVGAPSPYAFNPAAVQVSSDTTVTWEWTGRGSSHNVVDNDGAFESDYYLEAGSTFEYTVTEPGVYKYYCTPHQTQGMLGVIEVVES